MADCIIRKRHGIFGLFNTPQRYWYAVCPHCDKEIIGRHYVHTQSTRKIAKDKLYWHVRQHEVNGDIQARPGG